MGKIIAFEMFPISRWVTRLAKKFFGIFFANYLELSEIFPSLPLTQLVRIEDAVEAHSDINDW